MVQAPWASTFVALALIPAAVLFTHAYISGRKRWRFHNLTGTAAVLWDLSLSIFYMFYRLFGGQTDAGVLSINPSLTLYFALHGVIAAFVIALEIGVLSTGIIQWRRRKPIKWHRWLSNPLIILWFAAFISGEVVYIVYYLLS